MFRAIFYRFLWKLKSDKIPAHNFQAIVHERFGVTFPMFSKVDVVGSKAAPVWKFLVGQ